MLPSAQHTHVAQATRQTMLEMQAVLRTVERELPDTAAAVRLSSLEMSDAIEEVSLLRCSPLLTIESPVHLFAGLQLSCSAECHSLQAFHAPPSWTLTSIESYIS